MARVAIARLAGTIAVAGVPRRAAALDPTVEIHAGTRAVVSARAGA